MYFCGVEKSFRVVIFWPLAGRWIKVIERKEGQTASAFTRRGMQEFLFELAKAGICNLNGKFNSHLQIKEVHAPLFSAGVLDLEVFSLQTKGQRPESSPTAIFSVSLTFGSSDTDRNGYFHWC